MTTSRIGVAILATVLLAAAGPARADTWSGDFSSSWFSIGAWRDFAGPPAATEDAFFPQTQSGFPLGSTAVQLSASTTIKSFVVNSPLNAQYTFTGAAGAVLTATQEAEFQNDDLQSLNVHTISSLGLNTPRIEIYENAILSLDNSTVTTDLVLFDNNGRVDVNAGSSVQTLSYTFNTAAGELRVNSSGELRVAGDTKLLRGTTAINSGGQLNAAAGVDLEFNGTALLTFASGHAVDNLVHLKATGGGDITGASFIDVGNGEVGSLTVTGAGSTFTAGGSTCDWGNASSGNATVTVSSSAVATVAALRAGTDNGRFVGTVSGGATLRTTSNFTMGGGSTVRTVSLDVSGGTFEVDGLATFNNRAALNLASGTVNFDGGATFNAGSLAIWAGGSMNLGANSTLLIDGTDVVKTSNTGFIYSGATTTRIRNGGNFTTPGFFDFGNATLDMNNGFLTVGTAGGTVSDWGASASTTATLTNNARATYNSGLRMSGTGGGTTDATISGGARLVASFLTAGGPSTANVSLNVSGGRVESTGDISLFRGTAATVSAGGRMVAQDVILGAVGGGTAVLTVTGDGSLLDVNDELFAGREGTTTLNILDGADVDVATRTVIGELAGANGMIGVVGAGSSLLAGSSLAVGDSGMGTLGITSDAVVNVLGGATLNGSSKLDLSFNGSLEIAVGSTIENEGEIEVTDGSQIRGDIVNAGLLELYDSSVTRSVTQQADSAMRTDNSTVGSFTQLADAALLLDLRSASDFDNLTSTGAATLGGDVVVSLAGGFSPTLGAEFVVLVADSVTGVFATENFSPAPLSPGLAWDVRYGPTSVMLKVVSVGTNGDFDADGDVDGADFLKWQRGESPNSLSPGDLADWRANYGTGSLTATSVAVPEPLGAAMLSVIGVVTLLRRRRVVA